MPRFAANQTLLFTEIPFMERFAAARRAGLDAVEFMFPYDYELEDIKARLCAPHPQPCKAGLAGRDPAHP
jgi:hydroxypyruvate isomerase